MTKKQGETSFLPVLGCLNHFVWLVLIAVFLMAC
jgi:hypothetical protein